MGTERRLQRAAPPRARRAPKAPKPGNQEGTSVRQQPGLASTAGSSAQANVWGSQPSAQREPCGWRYSPGVLIGSFAQANVWGSPHDNVMSVNSPRHLTTDSSGPPSPQMFKVVRAQFVPEFHLRPSGTGAKKNNPSRVQSVPESHLRPSGTGAQKKNLEQSYFIPSPALRDGGQEKEPRAELLQHCTSE